MSFRGSFRGGAGGGAARGGFDGKMSVMTQVRKEKEVETARLHAKTFQAWMNAHLRKRDLRIEDLANDCKDGIMLINLLEIITNTTCPSKYTTSPKLPAHYIANVTIFLEYLNQFVTVNVNPPDIVDGNIKIILSVIWRVILFFQVQSKHDQTPENAKQPAARANREAKAKLMTWVSEKTGLQITDCENSFGDGVAFCRLIQAYDASLIPDHMIQPGNPLHNLSMAFDIAETLGVPKLLDPLDLTNPNPECRPDEQCIMTYLSEYPKLFLAKPATAYQTPLGADAFRPDPNSVISSLASININIPASALSSFSPSGSSSSSSPLPAYPGAIPGSIPSGSQSPVPQGGRYTFNPLVPGAAPDQSALPPGSAPTLKPNFGPGGIPTGSTIPGGIPGSIPGSNSPGGSVPGSYGVGGGAGGATGPGALPPFDPSMMSASFDPRSLGLDPNNPSSYLGGSGGPGGQPFGSFAPGSGSGVGVGVGAGPGGLDAPSRPPPPKSAFTPVVGGSESAPDGRPTSGAFNAAGPGGLDYQSLGLGSLPLGSGFPGGQTGGFAGGTASGGSPLGSMDPMWASKEAEFKAREAEWQKKEEERARMEEQWRLQLQQKALEQQQLQQQLEALKAEQARLLSRAADPAVVEQNQVMAEQISRLRSRLVGQLRVFVAEARSLRGGSGINPYCTLTLDRYREKTGKVKKSQNPRWNQEFNFFVTEQNWVLNVTVYDHKTVGAHEFLGKIDIPINQLEDGRPLSRWFELQAKKPGGKVSGEIKLDIDYKFES